MALAPAESPEEAISEESERGVLPLELFFDLVFVFAITQVTALMFDDPTWRGLGHGMLILAALWWAWGAYAWLTNELDPEEDGTRLVMFLAMGAMLVASLAVPRAFEGDGVLFGCAYFVVRAAHLLLFGLAPNDVGVRRAAKRLAVPSLLSATVLIVAGTTTGALNVALWIAALTFDYLGPVMSGMEGWRVSPGHFAERHSLIVLIALGESIVAVGAAGNDHLGGAVIAAAVLGLIVAAALWWAYFDVVAIVAGRKLRELTGVARVQVARDSYSYLHLLLVAGIVLMALGLRKTLSHVHESLDIVPAVALCGGVALYLVGHVLFRLRNIHTFNPHRTIAAAVCLALIPVANSVSALAAVALVALVLCVLITYEAIRFREARSRVRHAA